MPSFIIKKPCIPEHDVAGTIISVGDAVKDWSVGDQVFGIKPTMGDVFKTGKGVLSEYTALKQDNMYHLEKAS